MGNISFVRDLKAGVEFEYLHRWYFDVCICKTPYMSLVVASVGTCACCAPVFICIYC